MKHLLSGVAIAAVLAIAAPAFAQTPMSPSSAPSAAASAKPAAPKQMKRAMRHAKAMRHPGKRMAMVRGRGRGGKWSPDDAATADLNRQELARVQGGGMAPPPPMPPQNQALSGPKASGR